MSSLAPKNWSLLPRSKSRHNSRRRPRLNERRRMIHDYVCRICVLDFDDTIFPLSHFKVIQMHGNNPEVMAIFNTFQDHLTRIDAVVLAILEWIFTRAPWTYSYIVTDASDGWVQHAFSRFLPNTWKWLSARLASPRLNIVSAHASFANQTSVQSLWKLGTIGHIIDSHFLQPRESTSLTTTTTDDDDRKKSTISSNRRLSRSATSSASSTTVQRPINTENDPLEIDDDNDDDDSENGSCDDSLTLKPNEKSRRIHSRMRPIPDWSHEDFEPNEDFHDNRAEIDDNDRQFRNRIHLSDRLTCEFINIGNGPTETHATFELGHAVRVHPDYYLPTHTKIVKFETIPHGEVVLRQLRDLLHSLPRLFELQETGIVDDIGAFARSLGPDRS